MAFLLTAMSHSLFLVRIKQVNKTSYKVSFVVVFLLPVNV